MTQKYIIISIIVMIPKLVIIISYMAVFTTLEIKMAAKKEETFEQPSALGRAMFVFIRSRNSQELSHIAF